MANSIQFGGLTNGGSNSLTGAGSFAVGVPGQNGAQSSALYTPNPVTQVNSNAGSAALTEGAASVKAALQQATDSAQQGYSQANNTVGAAQLANQIGATDFLSGNTDLKALDPFVSAGQQATSQLSALLGNSGADAQTSAISALQNSPGFQFTLQQGTQALQNSAAAKGLLNSGAAAKELTSYAQGQAESLINQQAQNLLSVGQLGETAATTKAGIASSVTQQQSSIQSALAQQQASLQAQAGTQQATLQQNFSSQLAALQSQLSSQQQNAANLTAQLGTSNVQTQQVLAQQQQTTLLQNPVVQNLISGINNIKGLLSSPQVSSSLNVQQAQSQLQSNLAQLKALGVTGYN